MMINYKVDTHTYSLSYLDLREKYHQFVAMADEEFIRSLPEATHLACIICWLKEVGPDASIGDEGVVHELVHLMSLEDYRTDHRLRRVRDTFKGILLLA